MGNIDKLKSVVIGIAAVLCPVLACSGSAAGEFIRNAALLSAGFSEENSADIHTSSGENTSGAENTSGTNTATGTGTSTSTGDDIPDRTESSDSSEISDNPDISDPSEPTQKLGRIITKNRSTFVDDTDFSKFTTHSGKILRFAYSKGTGGGYVDLDSGAQVRNCTTVSASELLNASRSLPDMEIPEKTDEPLVLIYHTHTTESFLPQADWYDNSYPINTRDPSLSIVSVGDAICERLSQRGISSVHDCEIHNYPQHTGSYYNSAETIRRDLEEFPSIRLVLDIHRDGIISSDGSLPAPVVSINGKNAAQFMIISGCENETYHIPNYIENFKLAALLQNTAEQRFPNLARALLFDYRNYNQDMSTGALLIEVGSHGNSLDEVKYTGQLLGDIIADSVGKIKTAP